VVIGADDEEQLSPREYAEKLSQLRSREKKEEKTGRDEETSEIQKVESDEQDKSAVSNNSKEILPASTDEGQRGSSKYEKSSKKKERKSTGARKSIDPAESSGFTKRAETLPPTPRREISTPTPQGLKSPSTFDFSQQAVLDRCEDARKEIMERAEKARQELMRQFSPRSMATDDEIREEVSSVGMASDTLRPMYYPNPYRDGGNKEADGDDEPALDKASPKEESEHDPSTLTGSAGNSILSELSPALDDKYHSKNKNKNKSSSKKKKHNNHHHHHQHRDYPQLNQSSSGSTRSKLLWKGWKKTVGKVKQIVKDIDENRLPAPGLAKMTE
jgi:hypothetical protein